MNYEDVCAQKKDQTSSRFRVPLRERERDIPFFYFFLIEEIEMIIFHGIFVLS